MADESDLHRLELQTVRSFKWGQRTKQLQLLYGETSQFTTFLDAYCEENGEETVSFQAAGFDGVNSVVDHLARRGYVELENGKIMAVKSFSYIEGHHENDSEYQQHDDGYESDREEEEDGAESEERLRTASTSPAPAPPFEWDGPPVLFSGFLKKKGDKGLIKMYQKRFFRLCENGIIYYHAGERQKMSLAKGEINLNQAFAVEKDKSNVGFHIVMKTTARVWLLQGLNPDDRIEWLTYMARFVGQAPAKSKEDVEIAAVNKNIQHFAEDEWNLSVKGKTLEDVIHYEPGECSLALFGGTAYVHECKEASLSNGEAWIHDLPQDLDDRDIMIQSITDPSAVILEQTLYDEEKDEKTLLRKLVGLDIQVQAQHNSHVDDKRTFSGTLAYNEDADSFLLHDKKTHSVHFLDIGDCVSYTLKSTTPETSGAASHPKDPSPLFHEPSILVKMKSSQKKHKLDVSYVVPTGLDFETKYSCILSRDEAEVRFEGYWFVRNDTSKTFRGTRLSFITIPSQDPPERKVKKRSRLEATGAVTEKVGNKTGSQVTETTGKALSAVGSLRSKKDTQPIEPKVEKRRLIYSIPRTVTLPKKKTKQFNVLSAKFRVETTLLAKFEGPKFVDFPVISESHGRNLPSKVAWSLCFINSQENGLGTVMPAGIVDIYRRSAAGFGLEPITSTALKRHEPGDEIILALDALDRVSVSRKQTGFHFDREHMVMVEQFEILLSNRRNEELNITVEDSMYRWSAWEITASNIPFRKHPIHERFCLWDVTLAPGGAEKISYSVFYTKFPDPHNLKKQPTKEEIADNVKASAVAAASAAIE